MGDLSIILMITVFIISGGVFLNSFYSVDSEYYNDYELNTSSFESNNAGFFDNIRVSVSNITNGLAQIPYIPGIITSFISIIVVVLGLRYVRSGGT